jgi:hypothetical protein
VAKFNIDLLGAPELSKAFADLPDSLERKILVKALRQVGQVLLLAAKARAPRDQGKLASTMKVKPMKRSRRRVGIMVQTGTRAELGIIAMTRISYTGSGATLRVKRGKETGYYPAHIEFGYKDETGQHHAPNPYMRTAMRSSQDGILAILRQEIDNGIEKEFTKVTKQLEALG